MSPTLHNVLVTFIALIYVFGIVALMDFFVKKGFPQDLSRKVVHIAAGSWLLFWLIYDNSHWTKYLNITPSFIWTILLLQKGFFAKSDDKAVLTMTRNGDRRELLKGPLYFTLVMNLLGTIFYYSPVSLIAMGFLAFGDGLAPVIGTRFGKHKYFILSAKSIEGSIAFFVFGLFGAIFFSWLFFKEVNYNFILTAAFVATIVEGVSPKDLDNILIPLSIFLLSIFFF